MKYLLTTLFAFTAFCFVSYGQSVTGAGRSINMRTYWASAKGFISPLGIDVNSEINQLYLNTNKGPYLDNDWFPAKIVTIRGNYIDDETVEYRFDLYQHTLHFRTIGDEKVQVLPSATYRGFTLFTGMDSLQFIKLLPPLTKINRDIKFYEILIDNDKYRLLKVYYSNLDSYTVAGPSNDGRTKFRFQDGVQYFLEASNNEFALIKPKAKSIVEADATLKSALKMFEKEKGKIKNEESLLMFFGNL